MSPTVLIGWFAAVFALYIFWVSTLVLVGVHHDPAIHAGEHAILLAVVEIMAALAFLGRRWRGPAAATLIVLFGIAAAVTAFGGSVPAGLFFYACTAAFEPLVERAIDRQQSG